MSLVQVRLKENEKKSWKNHCQNLGESEANMLRKMMHLAMKDEGYISENKVQKHGKKAVVSFRVSDEDRTKIFERLALEGYSTPSQWTRSIVKSVLKDDPILPDNAIYAVRESSRQLAAIGRNLNQIARVLNTDSDKTSILKVESVHALSQKIDTHLDAVSQLIHYNLNPIGKENE